MRQQVAVDFPLLTKSASAFQSHKPRSTVSTRSAPDNYNNIIYVYKKKIHTYPDHPALWLDEQVHGRLLYSTVVETFSLQSHNDLICERIEEQ